MSVESPFAVKREVKKVAVVVFASNSSLCGGFNVPDGGRSAGSKPHLAVGKCHAKVLLQLFHSLVGRKLKKFADKIDHIAIRLTGETVETAVHLHAGVFIPVEGTAHHTVSVYGEAV